jgi:hypothetical protein
VLSRHPHVTPDQVTERVAARMARQSVLDRDDPAVFWVLIDESILRHEIGSPKIMADQLDKLAEMARRVTVTVQLVPGKGAHIGMRQRRRHGRSRHVAQGKLQRHQRKLH